MISVLDTNVVIYHLGGTLATRLPDEDVVVSVVTEIELLSYPSMTTVEERDVHVFLDSITVAWLTPDIRDAAVRLRREHRLRLPDAIIAGTALALDGELLTNDTRLARTPGLRSRVLALRAP